MKIDLRNITHEPRLSQETNAFIGDIYIDGLRVGVADNDGHGGETRVLIESRSLKQAAEAFCRTLPPVGFPAAYGGEAFTVPMNLPLYIDLLVEQHIATAR